MKKVLNTRQSINHKLLQKVSESVCECGESNSKSGDYSDYILGGMEARVNEFPWIVRLLSLNTTKTRVDIDVCGGSLVSQKVVLTAYHCVDTVVEGERRLRKFNSIPIENSVVVLGAHYIDMNKLDSYYTIKIKEAMAPTQENDVSKRELHDFAIVVLVEPAILGANVGIICLPPPAEDYGGKYAVAAGWGVFSTEHGAQSKVLRKVKLKVKKKSLLENNFIFETEVTRNQENQYMDTCIGDSGEIYITMKVE